MSWRPGSSLGMRVEMERRIGKKPLNLVNGDECRKRKITSKSCYLSKEIFVFKVTLRIPNKKKSTISCNEKTMGRKERDGWNERQQEGK